MEPGLKPAQTPLLEPPRSVRFLQAELPVLCGVGFGGRSGAFFPQDEELLGVASSRGRFLSVLVLALATVGLEVSVPFCVPPTMGLRTLPGAGAQGQCLRPARDVPLGRTQCLPSPEAQLP